MDWNSLERDFEKQTVSRYLGKNEGNVNDENNHALLNQVVDIPPQPPSAMLLHDTGSSYRNNLSSNDTYKTEYLLEELHKLRTTSRQQSSQITSLEKALVSERSTYNILQTDMMNRLNSLEEASKNNIANFNSESITSAMTTDPARRAYDDMVFSRLAALEDAISMAKNGENQAENIGHVLGSAIDHLYSVGSTAEAARDTSSQSVALVEMLLQAFYSIGNIEQNASPLDFLTNLASIDQQHRGMIKGLLVDSLRNAISSSIKSQIGAAADSFQELISPQMASIANKIKDTETTLDAKLQSTYSHVEGCIARLEESMSRLQGVHKTLESDAQDTHKKIADICTGYDKSMLTLKRDNRKLQERYDILHMEGFAPHTSNGENEELSLEHLHTLQNTVDTIRNTQSKIKNDNENSFFDMKNHIEKVKVAEADQRSRLEKYTTSTREEIGAIKQANQNIQSTLEQQTGELYRRFSKLEGKVEKNDKKDKALSVNTGWETQTNGLKVELEGLRQTIATMVFDIDDIKTQSNKTGAQVESLTQKSVSNTEIADLTAQERDIILQKVSLFESSLKNVQAEMDTLQEEIVLLGKEEVSNPIDAVISLGATTTDEKAHEEECSEESQNFRVESDDIHSDLDAEKLDNISNQPIASQSVVSLKADAGKIIIASITSDAVDELDESFASESEVPTFSSDGIAALPNSEDTKINTNKSNVSVSTDSANNSFSDESSSSSSSSSESSPGSDSDSEEVEEDLLGLSPPRSTNASKSPARGAAPSSPPGPTPSDVLAEQLRMRATYEREQAMKNINAKRTVSASKSVEEENSSVGSKQGSPKPVLSGSLLSGRRSTTNTGGSTTRNISKPIYDPTFGNAPASKEDATSDSSTNKTTFANATKTAAHAQVEKKDTTQCIHCLKRFPRSEMTSHGNICMLRTELCPNGCGAKIRAMKMDQHRGECPKK